ncbi:MAG: hypothetical protein HY964_06735 [Ignavibacteriales bacterium]|nr:hypothetical protein [Ignavibacteriales bacterium]
MTGHSPARRACGRQQAGKPATFAGSRVHSFIIEYREPKAHQPLAEENLFSQPHHKKEQFRNLILKIYSMPPCLPVSC